MRNNPVVNFKEVPSQFAEKTVVLNDGRSQLNNGVSCPKCGGIHSRVVDSRGAIVDGKLTVRRARRCGGCVQKFYTVELPSGEMERILRQADDLKKDALRWRMHMIQQELDK